jgi:hypothetical protein
MALSLSGVLTKLLPPPSLFAEALSSSLLMSESTGAWCSRSGDLAITDVRLLGIGSEGLGRFCIAAKTC